VEVRTPGWRIFRPTFGVQFGEFSPLEMAGSRVVGRGRVGGGVGRVVMVAVQPLLAACSVKAVVL
jgi:hypothetical protein